MSIKDNEVTLHPGITLNDVVEAYDELVVRYRDLQKNYDYLCDEYDLMLLEKVEKEMEIKEQNSKMKILEETKRNHGWTN